MNLITSILGSVVKPVSDIFVQREERKTAAEMGKAKIAQAKVEGLNSLEFQRGEWEALMAKASADSWKDEFWTIILATPFLMLLVGTIFDVFADDDRILIAANRSIELFGEANLDYGTLLYIAIAAAFGIRWLKR